MDMDNNNGFLMSDEKCITFNSSFSQLDENL